MTKFERCRSGRYGGRQHYRCSVRDEDGGVGLFEELMVERFGGRLQCSRGKDEGEARIGTPAQNRAARRFAELLRGAGEVRRIARSVVPDQGQERAVFLHFDFGEGAETAEKSGVSDAASATTESSFREVAISSNCTSAF